MKELPEEVKLGLYLQRWVDFREEKKRKRTLHLVSILNSVLSYLVPAWSLVVWVPIHIAAKKTFGMSRGQLNIISVSEVPGLELKGHSEANSRQTHSTNGWMVQTEWGPAMVFSTVPHLNGWPHTTFSSPVLCDHKSQSVPPFKFQTSLCEMDRIEPIFQGYEIEIKNKYVFMYVFTCTLHTFIVHSSRIDIYMIPDVIIIPHRMSEVEKTLKITLSTLQRKKSIGQDPWWT